MTVGCGGGGSDSGGSNNGELIDDLVVPGGRAVSQTGWTVQYAAGAQPTKEWTFLVYVNGANDLETYGVLNMNQLETVGSTANMHVAIQFKRIGGKFDSTNGDWTDTRRYYIRKDSNTSTIALNSRLMSQKSDVDMGDKASLQEFISWGMAMFPARKYCLVLWNHGAGWRSVKPPTRATSGRGFESPVTRGFSYDDMTGTHIDTKDLATAIARPDGGKWDVLAMDLSLMQMIEVGYEARNSASYIVGSEESPPGEGYPYDAIAAALNTTPTMDGSALAKVFVETTYARYGSGSNITQSALTASNIGAIVPALNALGKALNTVKASQGDNISLARAEAEAYEYPENKDLLHFLDRLDARVTDATVLNAVSTLRARVNSAILLNRNGTQHPLSKGIAIFLPTPSRYRTIDIEQANGFGQRFTDLAIAKDAPDWQEFLANGPN